MRGGYGVFFDSAEGREIDGSADIYPYVSRGNYHQTVGQTERSRRPTRCSRALPHPGPATPAANTFLAVSQSPEPRNPYVQQWSLGVQREVFANTIARIELHRQQGDEPADAAQHRPGAAVRSRPIRCPVLERKPFPNFIVYIDSDWCGRLELQRDERQARASRPRRAADRRLHVGEEHRLPSPPPPASAPAASTGGRAS